MGRRALTATTMTVLVALLVVAGLYGWRAISSPEDNDKTTTQKQKSGKGCDDGLKKGDIVKSSAVTVSVFNAGSRSGLAADTLGQLTDRRFIRGDIGNAPSGFSGVRFVRVLAPTVDDPAARLVALQFGRHTLVQKTKSDLGAGVDVVVGNEYVGLVKAPNQIKATARGSGC